MAIKANGTYSDNPWLICLPLNAGRPFTSHNVSTVCAFPSTDQQFSFFAELKHVISINTHAAIQTKSSCQILVQRVAFTCSAFVLLDKLSTSSAHNEHASLKI